MTLEDLYRRAASLRTETVAFCDRVGFDQAASDLMGDLETINKNYRVKWVYTRLNVSSPLKSERARNTETMRVMIERLSRAIEVYCYAKEHGVEKAMIWKLSNA